jgi:stage V sporulation protein SpoVS
MSATLLKDVNGVWVMSLTGMLRKAELDAVQKQAMDSGAVADDAKVLIIAREFGGWEPGADWGDVTFFIEHGHKIGKIAIVCDPDWEAKFLVFSGAGMRRAQVKSFRLGQIAEAHEWLTSQA